MVDSGQKFIGRNRAPRVQIEYDVELYGAEKKVNLPFISGVMSDLSGKNNSELPSIEERDFLEIDTDNFDERLKSMKPRVAFQIPNTITEEGNLSVDLNFESIEDFSPESIAKKVPGIKELVEAREELSNLLSYMDGKTGAEQIISNLLNDPALLKSLIKDSKPEVEVAENEAGKEWGGE